MGEWFDEIREVFKKHAKPGEAYTMELWEKLGLKRFDTWLFIVWANTYSVFRTIIDEVFNWADKGVVNGLYHFLTFWENLTSINSMPVTVLSVYAGATELRMIFKVSEIIGMKLKMTLR